MEGGERGSGAKKSRGLWEAPGRRGEAPEKEEIESGQRRSGRGGRSEEIGGTCGGGWGCDGLIRAVDFLEDVVCFFAVGHGADADEDAHALPWVRDLAFLAWVEVFDVAAVGAAGVEVRDVGGICDGVVEADDFGAGVAEAEQVVCVVLIDDAIEDLHGDRVIRELDAGAADRGAGSERGG